MIDVAKLTKLFSAIGHIFTTFSGVVTKFRDRDGVDVTVKPAGEVSPAQTEELHNGE